MEKSEEEEEEEENDEEERSLSAQRERERSLIVKEDKCIYSSVAEWGPWLDFGKENFLML